MQRKRIDVGVLGATGLVGQRIVARLAGHPWFNLAWVAASERSEGRRYGDIPWRLDEPRPDAARDLIVEAPAPGRAPHVVFSALDAAVAGDIERAFAGAGHLVVSNARNYRMEADVPLLIPEINAPHLDLVGVQRTARGWSGAIVTNPNCSTIFLAMVLAALRPFDLEAVLVSTLQAASGAGYPGVSSLDLLGNVVPFISGEEEKIEAETRKILGCLRGDRLEPASFAISAQTTRVPVVNGHTELVSVRLGTGPSLEDVAGALAGFAGPPQHERLPSAPPAPIVCLDGADRPQPRLDVDRDKGMSVCVGRLRRCPVLGYKLVALGHNTVRGAAGAALLNAELMMAKGMID